MPAPWVVPAVMGGLGSLGGKASAKQSNKPSSTRFQNTSYLSPFGGAQGSNFLNDFFFNQLPGGFGSAMGNLPGGPNQYSLGAAQQLFDLIGGGFDLPGINVPQLGPAPTAGLSDDIWARLRESGPSANVKSLGIPIGNMTPEQIADYISVKPEGLGDISGGRFLGGSPMLDSVIKRSSQDAVDAYARSTVPAIDSSFALGGRYGGGAHHGAQAQANADFTRNLMSGQQQMRLSDFQNEKNRQMQALGLEGQMDMQARGNLGGMRNTDLGVAGSLRGTAIGAATQRAIAEAGIASQLSMSNAAMRGKYDLGQAGFDMQGEMAGLQRAIQEAGLNMQGLGSLFGMGNTLYGQERQSALDPWSMLMQYGGAMLPGLAQFGTQNQSGYGQNIPSQVDPWAGFLTGGMGGLGAGYGALGDDVLGSKFS